nr:MAG TPA: hypothetical protein [Caudoviricetes sp.]
MVVFSFESVVGVISGGAFAFFRPCGGAFRMRQPCQHKGFQKRLHGRNAVSFKRLFNALCGAFGEAALHSKGLAPLLAVALLLRHSVVYLLRSGAELDAVVARVERHAHRALIGFWEIFTERGDNGGISRVVQCRPPLSMICTSGSCIQRQASSARLEKPYRAKMPSITANPRPFPNFQMKKITAERSAMIAVVANIAFRFVIRYPYFLRRLCANRRCFLIVSTV